MKAIVYTKYGTPDVFQLKEVEKPTAKEGEVLIKIHAASINSWDWDRLVAKQFFYRLLFGLFTPRIRIIGCDVAGRVETTGQNAKKFNPGDEVFGDISAAGWGGFAEYVCVNEKALTIKPQSMTFEEAASMPQAGLLALQGLRDKKQIQPGDKILINGAGGGVGCFAIQMAKAWGAEVTGVDHTGKLDMMRSVGADHVIDYTVENFTKRNRQYDLILDVTAHRSVFEYKRILRKDGAYIMAGGAVKRIFQLMLLGPLVSLFGKKKMGLLIHRPNKGIDLLIKLFESGKVKPVIDRCFTLPEVPDAFRYFGTGQFKGKIVITIS